MLYLIGLGLGDAEDVTVKGLKIIKRASRVYLEAYTSILTVGKEALEEFYGRELILADRDMVEQQSDIILKHADTEDVAFLVVGDPFGATTHSDLIIRALSCSIPYQVVHNASIMNAIGCCGLQLYNFGETVSFVFWTDDWQPDSYVDKIEANLRNNHHTLCLLDIKVKEQSIENMMKGRKVYEPPRYMTVSQAAEQLLTVLHQRQNKGQSQDVSALTEESICVGVARLGSTSQKIMAASLKQMASIDMGAPLHSLIIPGDLHFLECEMLKYYAFDDIIAKRLSDNRLKTKV
ncbi:diphthine methyl ester synthase-like isoform X1 [Corticium candelabrum]|uniref:diphthine methyl ester synthase-like isoform X1 n=1 Tax=Corticium candelabrum TaxID=121492 RepID=UPI002E2568AE|nr:diphthine methyl ester synthase-like isoform X1 [Corticium candelabrum]